MLQSMFHFSNPSMSYKHWLSAVLDYLFLQVEVNGENYILYLEHIAKLFVYNRFLANEYTSYDEMTKVEQLTSLTTATDFTNGKVLRYRSIRNNLVFYFLDYLIWLNLSEEEQRMKGFKFTPSNSVEHFYPQNPELESDRIDEKPLNSFGNLCLIKSGDNTRYSNFNPKTKRDEFLKRKTSKDSLKLFRMLKATEWNVEAIERHEEEMIEILKSNMNSSYVPNSGQDKAAQLFRYFQIHDPRTLIQAMLCFGNCIKQLRWDKFNFKDFDYIKAHEAYNSYKKYIEEHPEINNLKEIIAQKIDDKELQKQWRYLLIKYPETMTYAEMGNLIIDDSGRKIQLLVSQKNTLHKARNIYCFILQNKLNEKLNCDLYCDKYQLYIPITFENEYYKIVKNNQDISFEIRIFYYENAIHCQLDPAVNGNSKEIKLLKENDWKKNSEGTFIFKNKSKLFHLGENLDENVHKLIKKVLNLLKSNFGIKK